MLSWNNIQITLPLSDIMFGRRCGPRHHTWRRRMTLQWLFTAQNDSSMTLHWGPCVFGDYSDYFMKISKIIRNTRGGVLTPPRVLSLFLLILPNSQESLLVIQSHYFDYFMIIDWLFWLFLDYWLIIFWLFLDYWLIIFDYFWLFLEYCRIFQSDYLD